MNILVKKHLQSKKVSDRVTQYARDAFASKQCNRFHNFDPNFTFFTKFVVFEKNLSCAFCINIDASSSTTDNKKNLNSPTCHEKDAP